MVYLFFQIFGKLGMTTSRFATHAQSKYEFQAYNHNNTTV